MDTIDDTHHDTHGDTVHGDPHDDSRDVAGRLDEVGWWRTPCEVADQLFVSGDLAPGRAAALRQLAAWMRLGIRVVVDCRGEHSDEGFVAEHAPEVVYLHVGTHDAGGSQEPEWFTETVAAIRAASAATDGAVMIHCHMGVNRAPSMAFAVLLDRGWAPLDALDAILHARPIAAIAYAESALRWHHGRTGSDPADLIRDLALVEDWFVRNDVDAARSIGRIRRAG